MARRLCLLSLQALINRSSSASLPHRPIFTPTTPVLAISATRPWLARGYGRGAVSLVLSEGRPRFETIEPDSPSTREKYKTKKRLKLQRKREKRKRREACRTDPRRLRPVRKRRKDKFPSTEARIKYKIEKAKIKEAMLVEKLKKYEVPKVQGPVVKPEELTGEERFYMKKMAQKRSNYVPVGRRGVFGGVILNMHLHWKKHETVKVICKPCKPGQIHEYARDIARLSGGTPIQIIGDDTIVFYRGKNYVQPEVMSPIDTLSKKKALEKSKYEQSLETVRRFIAISEKELELYYRHVALYGDPNSRNSDLVYGDQQKSPYKLETATTGITEGRGAHSSNEEISTNLSDAVGDSDDELRETEVDSSSEELSETAEVDYYSDEYLETDLDSENEESNLDYRLTQPN